MSVSENKNTLVKSLSSLEKVRLVVGDKINMVAINKYKIYTKLKQYAEAQKESGAVGYEDKIKKLDAKMLKLTYICPTICNIK